MTFHLTSAIVGATVTSLCDMARLSLQAAFRIGNGGSTCRAYVQTSLDQGQTWFDVACFAFAAAPGEG